MVHRHGRGPLLRVAATVRDDETGDRGEDVLTALHDAHLRFVLAVLESPAPRERLGRAVDVDGAEPPELQRPDPELRRR
jgi:hypothetical protein